MVQFSVFTPNRLGRLHELVSSLALKNIHVLALTVLDATDSAIIRMVVDDPEKAREMFLQKGLAFSEAELVAVALDSATELSRLMGALLEAEVNIDYLYSFIPHPLGKSILALHMEDNDMAEKVLHRHQFHVLKQPDISR